MDRRTFRGQQKCQGDGADLGNVIGKETRSWLMVTVIVARQPGKAHGGDGMQAGLSRIPRRTRKNIPD